MSLESNKTLGGVGSILLAIPFLNIIGIILVLIAMKGMGDYYNDDDIFKNALYGFIFGFIGVIALIAVIIMLVFGFAVVSSTSTPPAASGITAIGLLILAFIILYVFSLLAALFYRKSLNILAEKSNQEMFNTAGLILLIGAAIPVIGEILKFVAWILVAVAFFNVKESTKESAPVEEVTETEGKKFCSNCGTPIQSEAAFCQKCGHKI